MVHKPVCPGPLRLMCLRVVAQAVYNFLEAKPKLEKYFALCGPKCRPETNRLIEYVSNFFPSNLRELLLEYLVQLWFSKVLRMKQKTIDHEMMSAGDPHHDHATCGGTTSVPEAQRQTNLLGEILSTAMTRQTKNIRFAFTNARSGSVDFSRPLAVISERCQSLRYLDLTFATDTLLQTKPGVELDTFNGVFLRDCLAIVKELLTYNNIQTLKLLMCNKAVLQEISKLSKLNVLEITEASLLRDSDLASFSQGSVRHNIAVMKIKVWSDVEHITHLCDNYSPRKLAQGFRQRNSRRIRIPDWAVFLLNCPNLTELQYFDPSQPRPFNPQVGLLTLLREMRLGAILEIENEGDLLDLVLEEPQDLERLRFKWSQVGFDMGNDGLVGSLSESDLTNHMEFLSATLPNLTGLGMTLFPSHMDFWTLHALTFTSAGKNLVSRLKSIKISVSHHAHLSKVAELLAQTKNLEVVVLEHLQVPQSHLVVNLDIRELLSWLPSTVSSLTVRGFHLLKRLNLARVEEGGGPAYPHLRHLSVTMCGTSDLELLHCCCLCPNLVTLTVVVSIKPNQGQPSQGLVSSHLHALCHNASLEQVVVLVKQGEGWIEMREREMLGELVLGSTSDHLRKIVLFPLRGICGGGLRSLVKAAKARNICCNIGLGNQRPVKTETNRRTANDQFTLLSSQPDGASFAQFGDFLEKKVSEYEGQFWNDPDWFYGGIWPEQGLELD